jgi:hypothetical protein
MCLHIFIFRVNGHYAKHRGQTGEKVICVYIKSLFEDLGPHANARGTVSDARIPHNLLINE